MLALLCAGQAAASNYIATKIYMDENDTNIAAFATQYSNGLGQDLQTRIDISASEGLVDFIQYDSAGRATNAWKPFAYDFGTNPKDFVPYSEFLEHAHVFNDDPWPYSSALYWDDPLGRTKGSGGPGAIFLPTEALGEAGNHATYVWYFARSDSTFLTASELANLDNVADQSDARYFLTVTRDPNKKAFSQSLSDMSGNVIKQWAHTDDAKTDILTASYRYGPTGVLLQETPPQESQPEASIGPSTYLYSTIGRLLKQQDPNTGMTEYKYGPLGELIAMQDEKQRQTGMGNEYTAVIYDIFNRIVAVGIAAGFADVTEQDAPALSDLLAVKIRNYYDTISNAAELDLPLFVSALSRNTRGRLAASASYDHTGSMTGMHRVIELYAYDDDGRLKDLYKLVPTLGVQRFSYTYTLQNNPLTITYYDDIAKQLNAKTSARYFEYNNLGQLVSVRNGGLLSSPKLIGFEYDKSGRLIRKKLYNTNGQTELAKTEYQFNIRDWPVAIAGSNASTASGFSEALDYYTNTASPRYDGNLAGSTASYSNVPGLPASPFYGYSYAYDRLGRVLSIDNAAVNSFDEAFAFYKDGRLKKKARGTTTVSGAADYQYETGSSRLANHPAKNIASNYLWDPNGNIVLDRSKRLAISWDWSDRAAVYAFYSEIPAAINGEALSWRNIGKLDESKIVSRVVMMYDAAGSRVLKTAFERK